MISRGFPVFQSPTGSRDDRLVGREFRWTNKNGDRRGRPFGARPQQDPPRRPHHRRPRLKRTHPADAPQRGDQLPDAGSEPVDVAHDRRGAALMGSLLEKVVRLAHATRLVLVALASASGGVARLAGSVRGTPATLCCARPAQRQGPSSRRSAPNRGARPARAAKNWKHPGVARNGLEARR